MPGRASFSEQRILVTGGTTGIGRAAVQLLAREGARVVTFGRDEEALNECLSSTRSAPGEVIGLAADVTVPEDISRVFAMADERFGGLDALVACAALGAEPIHEMADEEWRYVVETNLVGYLACARAALERMTRDGGGHLVFVGSISTEIKAVGESVYSATKAGVQAFAETLRKEVADLDIRVSVIQPGSTATDMQECSEPEKQAAVRDHRMLHAEQVAEAILFVLSRPASVDVVNLRIEPRLQKTH